MQRNWQNLNLLSPGKHLAKQSWRWFKAPDDKAITTTAATTPQPTSRVSVWSSLETIFWQKSPTSQLFPIEGQDTLDYCRVTTTQDSLPTRLQLISSASARPFPQIPYMLDNQLEANPSFPSIIFPWPVLNRLDSKLASLWAETNLANLPVALQIRFQLKVAPNPGEGLEEEELRFFSSSSLWGKVEGEEFFISERNSFQRRV